MLGANSRVTLECDAEAVWKAITDLNNQSWRRNIDRVEVIEEGRTFAEYTKSGTKTIFNIAEYKYLRCYELDFENENLKGHWIGNIKKTEKGTIIDITENVSVKKISHKPFVKMYLEKQQKHYIEDLKKAVSK